MSVFSNVMQDNRQLSVVVLLIVRWADIYILNVINFNININLTLLGCNNNLNLSNRILRHYIISIF